MAEFDAGIDQMEVSLNTLYVCARCRGICEYSSKASLHCPDCGGRYALQSGSGREYQQ